MHACSDPGSKYASGAGEDSCCVQRTDDLPSLEGGGGEGVLGSLYWTLHVDSAALLYECIHHKFKSSGCCCCCCCCWVVAAVEIHF